MSGFEPVPDATGGPSAAASAVAVLGLRPSQVPGFDDTEVVRLLVAAEVVGRRVDALRVALAGEVAQRSRRELGPERLSTTLGCRSAAEVVQRATGIAGPTAGRRIRLGLATRATVALTGARVPARFAQVAAALEDATVGTDAACAIIDTLSPTTRTATDTQIAAAESELVAAARCTQPSTPPPVDADTIRLQAGVWASFLDPDGTTPGERDAERRHLQLRAPRHGLVPITGLLLPEVAAALRAYTDACTNPRGTGVPDTTRNADNADATRTDPSADASRDASGDADASGDGEGAGLADGTGTHGHPGPVLTDQRSRGQQLHDILATIVHVAARAADAPSVAGNAPTVVVAVRAQDLQSGTGLAFADGSDAPLGMSAARHLACAGAIQRIALDTTGRVVGLWSPQRCFTGHQHRAIALRDGGCVIPGCAVPAAWCEVHHVIPHTQNPAGTTTDNGVLLCWHHHRTIDTSGWHIRMTGGTPQIRAPQWLDHTQTWRPARGSPTRLQELLTNTQHHPHAA